MSDRSPQSESEFLRGEAHKAREAVVRSLQSAGEALGHTVDPAAATRRHPLAALLSAAFIGFFATVVAIPSRQERELRHLERLRRAMNPQPPSPPANNGNDGNGSVKASQTAAAKPAIWGLILKELITFAKPIVAAQIAAKVKAEAVAPPASDRTSETMGEGPDKSRS